MSNVHGLFSGKKDGDDDKKKKDESNNRYVGGIGDHGGGRFVPKFSTAFALIFDLVV
jgi:hypothetical protein